MRTHAASSILVAIALAALLRPERLDAAGIIGPNVGIATSVRIENEPDVAVSQGKMVAAWYRGELYQGVGWGNSLDGGSTWTDGGGLPGIISGLPTLCADEFGNFYLAASVYAPGLQETFAVYRGVFTGAGFSWQGPTYAVPPLPPESPSNYDAAHIACDPSGGRVYLVYTSVVAGYAIQFVRSLDGGVTWSAPQTLSDPTCSAARVAVGPEGEVYVVWADFGLQQATGRRSGDLGASFGPAFAVGPMQDNFAAPPPAWESNYVRGHPRDPSDACRARAVNSPSLVIDRTTGPRRGALYVAWAEYGAGTVQPATGSAGDVEPNDWYVNAVPIQIGDDFSGYEVHEHTSGDADKYTFEGAAGTTIWIDCQWSTNYGVGATSIYELLCGRDTTQLVLTGCSTVYSESPPSPPVIFTLPADDRYYIRPPFPPDPFSNSSYTMQLRRYEVGPGEAARDHRDVVLVSSSDGGATWTGKVRVNDDPPRFDNSFPEVAVDDGGRVHAAWYDRRDDVSCGRQVHTYWTWSEDGGVSFQPSERVSEEISDVLSEANPWRVGDHLCLEAVGEDVWVVWGLARPGHTDLMGAKVRADVVTGIAVSGLEASLAGGLVRLTWRVSDAHELVGFLAERADEPGGGLMPLGADVVRADHEGSYTLEDLSVEPGHRYRYRLEVLKREGTSEWLGPVVVTVPPAVTRSLLAVTPNPFTESLALRLTLARAGAVEARVYDVSGHEVAVVGHGRLEAGTTAWQWDGRDRSGRRVRPGVYLLRVAAEGNTLTRRVTRLE